jgi:RNA polymerase sigma-70 factor (TIGR02943 family)
MNDFRSRVQAERPYLVRYARLQLRDGAAAEDAVQEALLAALAGESGFGGRSNLRTWLTGILKHKIIDVVRKQARDSAVLPQPDTAEFDALFDETGHWRDAPSDWGDPHAAMTQKQFLAALELCLERLPVKTAQVFMMREHLGCETDEICKELGVTPTHCWVLLYRARMVLRECLERTWSRA